jgi:hypothetical protein
VSRRDALRGRIARRRVGGLAAALRGDIRELRVGPPGEAERVRARMARRVRDLEEVLVLGLDFGFTPDAELGLRRGHARNIAVAMRSCVLAGSLAEASRLAQELIGTVGWIQARVREIEAAIPPDPWVDSWSGRLLAVAARALPRALRRDFIEDQCGNLSAVESRREWARYMLGLLVRMPAIAAAATAMTRGA